MADLGVIVTEMILCLVAALAIGALFAYLYARASTREEYEGKIDALQELCESKRKEAEEIKTLYGKLEVENARLEEEAAHCEELLVKCRASEEELLAQLDVIAQENASLQQKLSEMSGEGDMSHLVAEIAELKKILEKRSSELTDGMKKELQEELSQAEEMLKKGGKNGKIAALIHSILGKIAPK